MKRFTQAAAGLALAAFVAVTFAQDVPVSAFQPQNWNEFQRQNLSGTKTSEFHIKFVNFIDESGKWKRIDLNPKKDAAGFHITDAPYSADLPLKANGNIHFTSTNRYSVKEKKIRDDAPISAIKKFTNALPVNGIATDEGVLYAGALPDIGADLLLQPHEMELRYLVVWDSLPPACADPNATFEIPFTQTFNNGIVPRKRDNARIKGTKETIRGGYSVSTNDFRGIGSPVARIWDSAGKSETVDIVGRLIVNTLHGAKVIHCSSFVDAVYPVKTDATSTFFSGDSGDGEVRYAAIATYETVRTTANGSSANTSANPTRVRQLYFAGNGSYNIERTCTPFDTSSLTSSAVVTDAVVSVYGTQKADDAAHSPALHLVEMGCQSAETMVVSDYNYTLWGDTYGTLAYSSFSTTGYNDITLTDVSIISTDDYSRLGFRLSRDINGETPGSGGSNIEEGFYFHLSNETGTDKDPTLEVTYALPSTSSPIIILLSRILAPFAYAR